MAETEPTKIVMQLLSAAPALMLSIVAGNVIYSDTLPPNESRAELSSLHQAAEDLILLVSACIAGDRVQLRYASQLIATQSSIRPPVPIAAACLDLLVEIAEGRHAIEFLELLGLSLGLPRRLPALLDGILNSFSYVIPEDFDGDIVSCQHVLGSVVSQFAAMRLATPNARFSDIIGKPYSTNRSAYLEFLRLGFGIDRGSIVLPGRSDFELGSYQRFHRDIAAAQIESIVADHADSSKPIIVVDDGGSLIRAIGQYIQNGLIDRPVVCIEQTTYGLREARPYCVLQQQ